MHETTGVTAALWTGTSFYVIGIDEIKRENELVTLHISVSDESTFELLDGIRKLKPSSKLGLAYRLSGILGEFIRFTETTTRGGSHIELAIREIPISSGSFPEVHYKDEEVIERRARRILLNESLKWSSRRLGAETLNEATLELFVQNRRAPLPVIGSPFPLMWKAESRQPVEEFLEHARVIAVLFLFLSQTVDHIERLELQMPKRPRMRVDFVGDRRIDAGRGPAYKFEVRGEIDLEAVPQADAD
jgi:hypothetical protein